MNLDIKLCLLDQEIDILFLKSLPPTEYKKESYKNT